jgi:CheY-like chemotaxis protein
VLVIDDDPGIHTLIRGLLRPLGCDMVSAFDAVQGPMKARRAKPDLIVLDINMPGGTGFKVLKQLRNMDETFETPILVYSAVEREQLDASIRESPVTFILPKPATPEEIGTKIQELLGA